MILTIAIVKVSIGFYYFQCFKTDSNRTIRLYGIVTDDKAKPTHAIQQCFNKCVD